MAAEVFAWSASDRCAVHRVMVGRAPCNRAHLPGRTCCGEHQAELDLQILKACVSPDAEMLWVIEWQTGSKLLRRCSPRELARALFTRFPGAELELSPERFSYAARVDGRLVAMVRWDEPWAVQP